MSSARLSTQLGAVRGQVDGDVLVFRGLRYGEPPTGRRRFLAPQPAGAWDGEWDATGWPNRSLQPPAHPIFGSEERGEQSEDCLFLNVFSPGADGAGRPVMVWIHGGSYVTGSANGYDASVLAAQGDVVVVVINYRLGYCGFLDLSAYDEEFAGSASNGIRDQILALSWVRDNIRDYGGDPDNVSIFGESAGGGSVLALLGAPAAEGLFHRAIAHSPGDPGAQPLPVAQAVASQLEVGEDALVARLRAMSGEELIATQVAVPIAVSARIDGVVVTRSAPKAILRRGSAGVPVILGTNRDEGRLFSATGPDDDGIRTLVGSFLARALLEGADPATYLEALAKAHPQDTVKDRYERIWADRFRRPSIRTAEAATRAGPGGWLYRFDLPSSVLDGSLGACHASEIAFTFNALEKPGATLTLHEADDTARGLARRWSDTLLRFARTGEPDGGGLPPWPRYLDGDRSCLILDAEPRVERDVDLDQQRLWGDR